MECTRQCNLSCMSWSQQDIAVVGYSDVTTFIQTIAPCFAVSHLRARWPACCSWQWKEACLCPRNGRLQHWWPIEVLLGQECRMSVDFNVLIYLLMQGQGCSCCLPWCILAAVLALELDFWCWEVGHLRGMFWCSCASKDHCASHEDQIAPSPHLCSLYPHRGHCQFPGGLCGWPCRHICRLDFDLAAFLYIFWILFPANSPPTRTITAGTHESGYILPSSQLLNISTCWVAFLASVAFSVLMRPWFALSYQSCQRPDRLLSHLAWWQLSTSELKRKESSLTDPWCCRGDSGSLDPESPLAKEPGVKALETGWKPIAHSILFEQTRHR